MSRYVRTETARPLESSVVWMHAGPDLSQEDGAARRRWPCLRGLKERLVSTVGIPAEMLTEAWGSQLSRCGHCHGQETEPEEVLRPILLEVPALIVPSEKALGAA